MTDLKVFLFGQLQIILHGESLQIVGSKAQELFCYLLLHRDRMHRREALAELLWDSSTTAQGRKYLRQSLWKIQSALHDHESSAASIVETNGSWVGIKTDTSLWTDVSIVEDTIRQTQGVSAENLTIELTEMLQTAVKLYTGDLLEAWYQDWCVYERERLQNIYFGFLDKLTDRCIVDGSYEDGIYYARQILHLDRAHERAHRQLMRLFFLSRHRSDALRQFSICCSALEQELGVGPSRNTVALYMLIRADAPNTEAEIVLRRNTNGYPANDEAIAQLNQIQSNLAAVQHQVESWLRMMQNIGD